MPLFTYLSIARSPLGPKCGSSYIASRVKTSILEKDENFFQVLKIVNIQKRDFEGLVPALYSLDERSYHNPLASRFQKNRASLQERELLSHFGA